MRRLLRSPTLAKIVAVTAVISIWQVVGTTVPRVILPTFSEVVSAFYRLLTLQTIPQLPNAVGITLFEILASFAIAASLGVFTAFVLSSNRTLNGAILPLVVVIFAVPHIIFFPVTVVLFGLGSLSKIAYGVLAGFPVITLGATAAISRIDRSTVDVARSLGAGSRALLIKVVVPGSISSIATTLRVGFGVVLITTIVAEMLGSLSGLGYYLREEFEFFHTPDYFAMVALVMVVAVCLNQTASYFEQSVRKWSRA